MHLVALSLLATLAAPAAALASPEDVPAAAPPAATTPDTTTAAPTAPATTAPATPATATTATATTAEEPYPMFAVGLTAGAPDGAVLSFTYSPWYWFMVDAGFAYTLAPGFVLGVEFQPIDFFISPTVRGEYGYYFPGNTADKIKQWAGVPENQWPLVGNASYNWFSGLVGIALGSRRGFTFRLEGGIGWLQLNAKGGTGTINGVEVSTGEWKASAFMPVARISFLYFF